jgi:hypothetical protein
LHLYQLQDKGLKKVYVTKSFIPLIKREKVEVFTCYIGWKRRLLKKPKADKFGKIGQPRPEAGGRKEKHSSCMQPPAKPGAIYTAGRASGKRVKSSYGKDSWVYDYIYDIRDLVTR